MLYFSIWIFPVKYKFPFLYNNDTYGVVEKAIMKSIKNIIKADENIEFHECVDHLSERKCKN